MKKLIKISSIVGIVGGSALVVAGVWGVYFTYQSIAEEHIVTPADATISKKPVRGPLTLMAQADIIRKHTLATTGGKTFAEMPRQIPKLDENGQPVLDVKGDPVMVANEARNVWFSATTLITALNLGILTYAFSALVIVFGLVLIWFGMLLRVLHRRDIQQDRMIR